MKYLQMAMKYPTKIAYRTAARLLTARYEHEKAIDYCMRAIERGPNEYRSNAFMASFLTYVGGARMNRSRLQKGCAGPTRPACGDIP